MKGRVGCFDGEWALAGSLKSTDHDTGCGSQADHGEETEKIDIEGNITGSEFDGADSSDQQDEDCKSHDVQEEMGS